MRQAFRSIHFSGRDPLGTRRLTSHPAASHRPGLNLLLYPGQRELQMHVSHAGPPWEDHSSRKICSPAPSSQLRLMVGDGVSTQPLQNRRAVCAWRVEGGHHTVKGSYWQGPHSPVLRDLEEANQAERPSERAGGFEYSSWHSEHPLCPHLRFFPFTLLRDISCFMPSLEIEWGTAV